MNILLCVALCITMFSAGVVFGAYWCASSMEHPDDTQQ
jgi:hypothetical protein